MKYHPRNQHHSMLTLLIRLQGCRDQEGGFAMVTTAALLVILSVLLVTAALVSKVDTASTNASAKGSKGFAAAEAGLNLRAREVRNRFEGFNRPSGTSPSGWAACTDGSSGNDGTGDFDCETITFQDQDIHTYVEEDSSNPSSIEIPVGEPFAGLTAQEYRYDVVSVPLDNEELPTAILGMRFKSRLVPLFQFAAFYEQDLDLALPPSITINGPVHSNHDLYLNASGTLTINGQVTTASRLFRGQKINPSCNATVNIHVNPASFSPLACSNGSSTRTEYTESDVTPWNNRIAFLPAALSIPEPDIFNATPGSLYWDRADLRIVLTLDGDNDPTGIEIRNQDGSPDVPATNRLLNSCSVTEANLEDEGSGDPDYEILDTRLNLDDTSGFDEGDVVTVGDDIDSNVIRPGGVNSGDIRLQRRLGHDEYQSNPIVSAGATVRKAVVSTSDTFFNYREKDGGSGDNAGSVIRMLNIDMEALIDCVDEQTLMGGTALDDETDGGLVWFFTIDGPDSNTDVTASGDPNDYGVRLYNGTELDAAGAPDIQGLTVISDQAIYVRGDYNSTNKIRQRLWQIQSMCFPMPGN